MESEVVIYTKCEDDTLMPKYMSEGAAGADVYAANQEPITLFPGETALIPTGLYFEIPLGYEIQVRPRSGLAYKHQLTLLNTPGTIDSDYRGELKLILINHSPSEAFTVEYGLRMAQIIVAPVIQVKFLPLKTALTKSARGSAGFGSSGLN